ncbi:MAG: PD40 domain-containing protein [Anaerolineales bacterium]|nr:PD40 domain-containing protein [Anaerolineales bacterium]
MKKKYIVATIAGGLAILFIVALGFLYHNQTKKLPPPIYAFASDRSGNGDIFGLNRDGDLISLTDDPSADWDPAWSADGSMLAFTSHRSGNSDIWLLNVVETGDKAVPHNLTADPAWDYSPSWSPSGQSVAFVSERDGDPEIFVQNLESNSALQLTFNNEMDHLPAWSPDGKMIAFAAVRDGVERIHLIRPDGTDEQFASPPSIKGTSPAWSPDSQRLAFIGWDEQDQPGIYLMGPGETDLQLRYQARSWIGSLDWSADGEWLTFTAWDSGNHEVYALPAEGVDGYPLRLTVDDAWDDFLVVNPQAPFFDAPHDNVAQAAPAISLPPDEQFFTGANIADLSMTYLINDLGLGWGKSYVNWATVEPEPGEFRWIDPDNITKAMGDQQIKILMRVHGTPAWARPANSSYTHPPQDMDDFGRFMSALATRYKGKVAAYEIWNEPNLNYEWGNGQPDPAAYTEMLKAAYTAVKAADPEALVITGGLATTGDGSATAVGDLAFLQGMYDAGAKGYFDAVGSHPYTFGRSPDEIDLWGLSLSRVEEQYEVMQDNDDGQTRVWVTELGWVIASNWDLGEHQAIAVSQTQQAKYLTAAFEKLENDWPFVQAVFLFNLDFSTVAWYPSAEPMRWYAILNPDRTPRPAYTELRLSRRTP